MHDKDPGAEPVPRQGWEETDAGLERGRDVAGEAGAEVAGKPLLLAQFPGSLHGREPT